MPQRPGAGPRGARGGDLVSTIAERVTAGAAWLDATRPGWDQLVDLGRLDMQSACLCVLGQVFAAAADDAGYIYGFDYAARMLLEGNDDAFASGFTCDYSLPSWPEREADFGALDGAWRELISRRRAS